MYKGFTYHKRNENHLNNVSAGIREENKLSNKDW